jgi:hypothetical protein
MIILQKETLFFGGLQNALPAILATLFRQFIKRVFDDSWNGFRRFLERFLAILGTVFGDSRNAFSTILATGLTILATGLTILATIILQKGIIILWRFIKLFHDSLPDLPTTKESYSSLVYKTLLPICNAFSAIDNIL